MTRVTIDRETRNRLLGLNESLEFFDESGLALGYFTPTQIESKGLVPQISRDEIERRLREDERLTTSHVLAHLESL